MGARRDGRRGPLLRMVDDARRDRGDGPFDFAARARRGGGRGAAGPQGGGAAAERSRKAAARRAAEEEAAPEGREAGQGPAEAAGGRGAALLAAGGRGAGAAAARVEGEDESGSLRAAGSAARGALRPRRSPAGSVGPRAGGAARREAPRRAFRAGGARLAPSRPAGSALAGRGAAAAPKGPLAKAAALAAGGALPAAGGAGAAAAVAATACAAIVAVFSFSWFWEDANRGAAAVPLPAACEALRGEVEEVCAEVLDEAGWADFILALMAAESGGDLGVPAAGGADYVSCPGGCGTPLSSVRQDVMQASECGYGGVVVHGASRGSPVACCPSVGEWPWRDAGASTARASIYAGTLYFRDGLEMWSGYLGEIGIEDAGKLALIAQGYNYNMSAWFSWCQARGIEEWSIDASEEFQATLPEGFKGTANHAEKVMAYYPWGTGSEGGSDAQRSLADIARQNATNSPYYQQQCARWANDMYDRAFGSGACARYASAWDDWLANGVSEDAGAIPVGAAVYASGWPYPGLGAENPYGHVGIYLGDGQVADYSRVWSLLEWASSQYANCNGRVGWLGWGWLSGDDLSRR